VPLIRTYVSEEHIACIIRMTGISELAELHHDDGGDTLLRNVGSYKNYTG
jgi:hypothetical protein